MKLTPFTFNGSTINDGTNYISKLIETSHNQGAADVIELGRTNNFPLYAGKELQSKNLFLAVDMKGTIASQIENVKKIFNISDYSQHSFICKDENNSNKQWYINATPINEEWEANAVTYTLNTDDPVWKSVIQGTLTVSMGTTNVLGTTTVGGNKYALPVIRITPTMAKGDIRYAYRRFVTLYNKNPINNYGYYPVNLTDNGSGTAFIAGSTLVAGTKLLANGNDLRVFVDGKPTNHYIGGTINSGTTLIWSNIYIPPGEPMTLGTAISAGTFSGTIWFQETSANQEALKAIPAKGLLESNGEVFYYDAKDWKDYNVSGAVRAAKLTIATTHSVGGTFQWLPHEIWVVYGCPTIEPLVIPQETKPMLNTHVSRNNVWYYSEFGSYDGKRVRQWKPGKLISKGGESYWYTGNQGTEKTDPFTELGCAIASYKNGNNWQAEKAEINWLLTQPAGATTLVYSGEKYIATSNSWPESYTGWSYANSTTERPIFATAISAPASYGSWSAFSGTVTPTGGSAYTYWWFGLKGSIRAAVANKSYLEANNVYAYLDKYPYVSLGPENGNYHLLMYIRNAQTTERIKLEAVLGLDDTLIVDCKNKTVTLEVDGEKQSNNLINALTTITSISDEWLTLAPGEANVLSFYENGASGLTIQTTYEERML